MWGSGRAFSPSVVSIVKTVHAQEQDFRFALDKVQLYNSPGGTSSRRIVVIVR